MKSVALILLAALVTTSVPLFAEQAKPPAPAPTQGPKTPPTAGAIQPDLINPPADYVIGVGDVLFVNYWRDKDNMTGDYPVRPDGKVTLPLLNDVDAAGLTTEQLRDRLTKASLKFLEDPTITVGVRAINSRKVYISGGIIKPGPYDLLIPMDVFSLIATAGGLKEFVNGKNILIIRDEGGKQNTFPFNYQDFSRGRADALRKNIPLKPGDRIVVPE
jgi:polysaccharide export outer membrane protein